MLEGKCAVVTGSTSGIGLAIARALAREGAAVMLNGFGEADAIAALEAELERDHNVAVAHDGADMRDPAAIERMIGRAWDAFGGVDVLVNNAGIQHVAPVDEFPPERWDAIIAVNLSAVFHATRAALPGMKDRGWGRIINTGSTHALVASVNKAAYVAAKHGIVGLTKVVALETAETGITCNAICPGWTRTELIERQIAERAAALGVSIEEGARDLLSEKQPSKAFVGTDDVAQLAVFLCSDSAAQITGAALAIDGGWTAQ